MKSTYQPLISVIINCYNGQKYLRQSIKSVINQKYKNWEIIFFDNSSIDQSISIAKSFKSRKIKIFKSKKYLKLYDARNKAIKHAKGKYISFLDVDDLWHPNKLSLQIKYLTEKKKKIVYSNYYLLKRKKKYISGFSKLFKEGYVTQNLLDNYWIGILTVLMSKSLFKKKKFNHKYEIIGDFDFFINLSLTNYICFINKPLAYYRVHEDNLSKKKIDLWIRELRDWMKKNNKRFVKKGFKVSNQKKYLYKLQLKKIFNNLNEKFNFKHI